MIVFGDSLSDGGFFVGLRFTNPGGLLWHEYLADELDLDRATFSRGFLFREIGYNFAVGATLVSGLQSQVNRFDNRSESFATGDLCTLWIGGNDVIGYTLGPNLEADMTALATTVGGIIQQLVDRGVDRIVVPNLPDIGSVPRFVGTSQSADKRTITIAFNTALANELDLQDLDPRVTIHRLDIFTLFDEMLFYAADYGFSNVTDELDGATGSPAHTIVVPAPGPTRGFYQTRVML